MLLSADCEEFSERRTLFLFIFVAVINGLISEISSDPERFAVEESKWYN